MAKANGKGTGGADQSQADKATDDALNERIKTLLKEHEAKVLALPDFKPPDSRDQAIALLDRIGVTLAAPTAPAEGDPPAPPTPPKTDDPAPPPAVAKPPTLSRAGMELAWNEDAGAVAVEMSRDRHSWAIEADVPAGTTAYSPNNHKGTGFYRVRSAHGLSNDVVIHFNSPA